MMLNKKEVFIWRQQEHKKEVTCSNEISLANVFD